MLERLRRLGRSLGAHGNEHPDIEQLVAWHDGELDPRRAESIAKHLRDCGDCRLEAEGTELSLARLAELPGDSAEIPPLQQGLERLLRTIRDKDALAAEQERLRKQRNRRLAAELRAYLGSYPQVLLERAAEGGPVFRGEIERLVRTFLGERAASVLLGSIDFKLGGA